MDRDLAKRLNVIVNTADTMSVLQAYADARIAILKERLVTEQDPSRIRGLQESIVELRRFETLRDEVNRELKP